MALIRRIDVLIETASAAGSGTDGDVYAGVCGREFCCDSENNDFEAGSRFMYRFGERSEFAERKMLNRPINDPRKQQLFTEEVDLFPVYIRFDPAGRSDNWKLDLAVLAVNADVDRLYSSLRNAPDGIWFGTKAGLCLHLRKDFEPRRPVFDADQELAKAMAQVSRTRKRS
jgi:hypothetical protein